MHQAHVPSVVVACDVGGTFTDVVALLPRGVRHWKFPNPTNAEELGSGVLERLQHEMDTDAFSLQLLHGTTVASNALIEQTGARTAMVTSRGLRDTLEHRRLIRPGVYDVAWERQEALVSRDLRFELAEETRVSGGNIATPTHDDLRRLLGLLRFSKAESVAVCFMNAYLDPVSEIAVVEYLHQMLPDVSVSASHEICPHVGEYERSSTVAVNAYLQPVVASHLDSLEHAMKGRLAGPALVMQSNGGLADSAGARKRPIGLVESGPAAGVIAAARMGTHLGLRKIVALDMGGTTVKACLIENGVAVEREEFEAGGHGNLASRFNQGAGHLIRAPSFDLVELGAGGGSIAWLDKGILRVGPKSAGADPGPACYSRGGTEFTVTDANVVLGIASTVFGDGSLALDTRASWKASETLQAGLGVDAVDVALGTRAVVNAVMVRALRAVTTERGRDTTEYALVAFGGSGPAHAAEVAAAVGIKTVLIPPLAGVFSALGLLVAESRFDVSQTIAPIQLTTLDGLDGAGALRLSEEIRRVTEAARAQDDSGDTRTETYLHIRYSEQSQPLRVAIPDGVESRAVVKLFEEEHLQTFGYTREDDVLEVVAIHVRLVGMDSLHAGDLFAKYDPRLERMQDGAGRRVVLDQTRTPARILTGLQEGRSVMGPAVIDRSDYSVVVPQGWSATAGEMGATRMEVQGAGQADKEVE